ncbi:NDP-hexose 2,3-dehydratase family protein [Kitasatospora sp. NPDC101801]|uniref:NDP-hexose 2,3-dehydratase family protein n=1 Tax=Kitasatospora sp. NPDC101801 TaxID=3364103 RepID=UPI0038196FFB
MALAADTRTAARPDPAPSADPAARLALSAAAVAGAEEVTDWLAERQQAGTFEVERIPFDRMEKWLTVPATGDLVHETGRFFSVRGLEIREEDGRTWSQPIICQPETGILGILAKEFDGVLHFLMQAKVEPGNIGPVQLGPTVQATRSNYMRVHQGRATPYLAYFLAEERGTVLTDVLQSEQGDSFLRKRNRNLVVEVTGEVEVGPDHRWLTLGQIHRLLAVDNLVNMDARTVLSSLPLAAATGEPAGRAGSDTEVLSWLAELKAMQVREVQLVPLDRVTGWRRTATEIAHTEGRHHRVIAVSVLAGNREVSRWTQPLLEVERPGLAAMVVRRSAEGPQLLVQGLTQPGTFDAVEMAPTVQCVSDGFSDLPEQPPFRDLVLAAPPEQVLYSAVLSEEGGRFHRRANRYLIVAAGDDFPSRLPDGFCWVTLNQVRRFIQFGNHFTVEARTLVTCLGSLHGGEGGWSA